MTTPSLYLCTSRPLSRLPNLQILVGAPVRHTFGLLPRLLTPPKDAVVLAWGRKPSAHAAERLAEQIRRPLHRIEDGFLRSVGIGANDPPLSIVLDEAGIYYDCSKPSCLENLVRSPLTDSQIARAKSLRQRWVEAGISKYNHAPDPDPASLPEDFVLLVDQTHGDASIHFGNASPATFERAAEAALAEHPGRTVLIKTHPEVVAGLKRSCFDLARLQKHPRVRIFTADAHPVHLLERATAVYVVTSQLGFEALLHNRPVRVFGMPFYAGWGLTNDDQPRPDRRCNASIEQLVHAALVDYPRYLHPEEGVCCEVETVLEHLALQRKERARLPRRLFAIDFPVYKRRDLAAFFPGVSITYTTKAKWIPAMQTPACAWGMSVDPENQLCNADNPLWRIEDGFIRSVGLGAGYAPPASWILDSQGIYFDSRAPSELEHILQHRSFTPDELARSRRIIDQIVRDAITKYNVGTGCWNRPAGANTVLLVVGQVETDASIRFGSPVLRTNLALLQRVRSNHPGAYVAYKPHPDVAAGLRKEISRMDEMAAFCDEIVGDVPIGRLFSEVDEVHTLTSLAGFEALLRGKNVHCYGQPFYSGWGLTTDHAPLPRRTARRTIEELAAACLIVYPRYISRVTSRFTTPERTLFEIKNWHRLKSQPVGVLQRLCAALASSPLGPILFRER